MLSDLRTQNLEVGERNLSEVLAGVYATRAQAAERRALGE